MGNLAINGNFPKLFWHNQRVSGMLAVASSSNKSRTVVRVASGVTGIWLVFPIGHLLGMGNLSRDSCVCWVRQKSTIFCYTVTNLFWMAMGHLIFKHQLVPISPAHTGPMTRLTRPQHLGSRRFGVWMVSATPQCFGVITIVREK